MLKQSAEIGKLKTSRPRDFWKKFKQKSNQPITDLDIENFKQHFSEVYETIKTTVLGDVEHFNESSDFNIDDPTFSELNVPITSQETKRAIDGLKRNKASSPCDNLLNEYFLESSDILLGHITDLFNLIFDAGYFPELWSQGYIVP